jgi:hypothetical protein
MLFGKKLAMLALAATLTSIAGCSHVVDPYEVSAENVSLMKDQFKDRRLIVTLAPDSTQTKSMTCRLEGSVSAPSQDTLEQYVVDAVNRELKFSKPAATAKEERVVIKVESLEFTSTGDGKADLPQWEIKSAVTAGEKTVQVDFAHPFSMVWRADAACNEVARQFPIFVRGYISQLVSAVP